MACCAVAIYLIAHIIDAIAALRALLFGMPPAVEAVLSPSVAWTPARGPTPTPTPSDMARRPSRLVPILPPLP